MKNKILILVLVFAFLWRFVGIYPGYPVHPDEGMSYSQGLAMLTEKTLDAHGYAYTYAYPNVVPIINAIFFKLIFIPVSWIWFFVNHITQLIDGFLQIIPSPLERNRLFHVYILGQGGINPLYWGRFVGALFGFGSVVLSYVLGKKIYNKKLATIWMFFMAANWRMVLGSHINLPDIYNVFFLLLSLFFSIRITEKQNVKNYFLAGVFAGVSFSVKFQVFSYVLFAVCYLYNLIKTRKLNLNLTFIAVFSSLLFILLVNPYHFLHWQTTLAQMTYVASKYGVGKNTLYIYPISYLYHYAIGPFAIFLSILGILFLIIKKNIFKLFLLLSPVLFGLYLFAYYSGGGFYTRNLLTLIPFILLFSSFGIIFIGIILARFVKNKVFVNLVLAAIILFGYSAQIKASSLVSINYTKEWNSVVIEEWMKENIPHDSKIAAHGSLILPIEDSNRLAFEENEAFSVDEFKKSGADYAVANFAWATNSFYWWMTGVPQKYMLNYFNKPVDLLEYSYQAIALRELSGSAIYWVSKPWQASEVNFFVAKVPAHQSSEKSEVVSYSFYNGEEGWKKSGKAWAEDDNLKWRKEGLFLEAKNLLLPSIRWESPVIEVKNWQGFSIDYEVNSSSDLTDRKAAYIFVSFYNTKQDAEQSINRIGVRLSERQRANSLWQIKTLDGLIPNNAQYMTVSFSTFDNSQTESTLSWLKVYRSKVKVDYGGAKIIPIQINSEDLFPNSHGNL